MTPTDLTEWMQRLGFNTVSASKALGISRTTIAAYLSGKYAVPKLVVLACTALEFCRKDKII